MGGPRACIDIGGTKVAVSLVGAQGQGFLARRVAPTVTSGTPLALSAQVLQMVQLSHRADHRPREHACATDEGEQQDGARLRGAQCLQRGRLEIDGRERTRQP